MDPFLQDRSDFLISLTLKLEHQMVITSFYTGSHQDDTVWIQEIISLKLKKGHQDPFQKKVRIILNKISNYFLRKVFKKIFITI